MAQPIAPEDWQPGITDNRFLPGRYSLGIWTGNDVKIANNKAATVSVDIAISDYITNYDDRRVNGLSGTNPGGNDGVGASAFGVFQDVRLTTRYYSMGRHRSMALRVWEEPQYDGDVGYYGDASTSSVYAPGQNLSVVSNLMAEAKKRWDAEVLGPDIDKYNFFAIANGHMSGRFIQDDPDVIFDGEGTWIATPGRWQGAAVPPSFAPITCIEYDNFNIPKWLNNIETVWTNLFIPEDNRMIVIDKFYKYDFLAALTGGNVPATSEAYKAIETGTFKTLWGWDFKFDVPTQYFPKVWVDDNLNVVHDATGTAPYDAYINGPASGALDGMPDGLKLQIILTEQNRTRQTNYIRTVYNKATGEFEQRTYNYPLGQPSAVPYLGTGLQVEGPDIGHPGSPSANNAHAAWGLDPAPSAPYDPAYLKPNFPGIGIGDLASGPVGTPVRRQVIGFVVYKPAAQLSQEYSNLYTASGTDGVLRGKFQEMATEIKYDAWVIEQFAHGIMPILDSKEDVGAPYIPVHDVGEITPPPVPPEATAVHVYPTQMEITIGETRGITATVEGTGQFDKGVLFSSDNNAVAVVSDSGIVRGIAAGTATITVTSMQTPSVTATVSVTVV